MNFGHILKKESSNYRKILRYRLPSFVVLIILSIVPSEGFGISTCLFNWLFKFPCPACGLSRSMSSFLNFEWSKSFSYHPLGFILLGFISLCIVTNDPYYLRSKFGLRNEIFKIVFSYKFLVLLFLIVWVVRLTNQYLLRT